MRYSHPKSSHGYFTFLSPIGLKIGLSIALDRNDGQNKLEDCISKNMAKMAKKWLKISRAATFGQTWFLGWPLAITWSSYIRFGRSTLALKLSAHRDESIGEKIGLDFCFWPSFATRGHLDHDGRAPCKPQSTLRMLVLARPYLSTPTRNWKISFPKKSLPYHQNIFIAQTLCL